MVIPPSRGDSSVNEWSKAIKKPHPCDYSHGGAVTTSSGSPIASKSLAINLPRPTPAVHRKMPDNPAGWGKAFACLSGGNEVWVKNAPVLLLSVAAPTFRANGRPNRLPWQPVCHSLRCCEITKIYSILRLLWIQCPAQGTQRHRKYIIALAEEQLLGPRLEGSDEQVVWGRCAVLEVQATPDPPADQAVD
jgi:hypothetical protein